MRPETDISRVAKFSKLKSPKLIDYWKRHQNSYLKWNQLEHVDEFMCFSSNSY